MPSSNAKTLQFKKNLRVLRYRPAAGVTLRYHKHIFPLCWSETVVKIPISDAIKVRKRLCNAFPYHREN